MSVMLEIEENVEQTEGSLEVLVRTEFLAHHADGVARLNNGGFGSCPASVLSSQARWASLWLRQPDYFYFGPLQDAILNSRRAVASLVHAHSVDQVVLVDNVTVAVSMLLQNFVWRFIEGKFEKGDAVIALNFSYGSVKKALKAYLVRVGACLIEVKLPFPLMSKEEILDAFKVTLLRARRASQKVRLAVIDHITSMPTIVLPIKEIVSLCRREGVDEVFVDGAHAIGNIDIDVEDIGADYYTSNLHKWLFCPPSVAFLHCRAEHLPDLHHPIVAHNYQEGLGRECEWVGTRDYSAHLAVVDAVQFFNKLKGGVHEVQEHNHRTVMLMGAMLADAWGTHCGTPPHLSSSMLMVGLPNAMGVHSHNDALSLRKRLREEFGIEVPVYYSLDASLQSLEGGVTPPFSAYVRISHQIYNSAEDYHKLRDAVTFIAEHG